MPSPHTCDILQVQQRRPPLCPNNACPRNLPRTCEIVKVPFMRSVKPNASAEYEVGQDIVLSKPPLFNHGPPDNIYGRCVRPVRTNLPVVRLSLNCSQCGGCSNKLRHPDRDLGRLRMIWRLHVAWGGYLYSLTGRVWSAAGKGLRLPWLSHRGRRGRSAREYRCLPRRGR